MLFDQGGNILDQLLSLCDPGAHLVGFEVDKIQVITFLTSCEEIVVHLGQHLGNLVGFDQMAIEEATYSGMFSGRETLLEQQGGYRVKAGIVKAVHTSGPTTGIGEHASIFQGLACSLQTVSHDIGLRLHYSVTPSRSTFCRNGIAR